MGTRDLPRITRKPASRDTEGSLKKFPSGLVLAISPLYMDLGRNVDVKRVNFEEMAEEAGIRSALVLGRLDAMCEKIGLAARELAENLRHTWPSDVYDRIVRVIDLQSDQVREA